MQQSARNPNPWSALEQELDSWAANGLIATLWWRDDDAVDATAELDRLLGIADEIPLSIAAIPNAATDMLAARLSSCATVSVLQHGFAHTNHAPTAEKKAEFGDHRSPDQMLAEIRSGKARLEALIAPQFLPVFVPPWNRMSDTLAGRLAELGFKAASTFGTKNEQGMFPHLNAHLDVIDWHGTRAFCGEEPILESLTHHLSMRRLGRAAIDRPTGLMTHHLNHDEETWRFLERLLEVTMQHPAISWIGADTCLETLS